MRTFTTLQTTTMKRHFFNTSNFSALVVGQRIIRGFLLPNINQNLNFL
jgi:hypothetical protein